jgi:hypothetical protein
MGRLRIRRRPQLTSGLAFRQQWQPAGLVLLVIGGVASRLRFRSPQKKLLKKVVRTGRVELPWPFGRQILSLVRLPIPPRSRARHTLDLGYQGSRLCQQLRQLFDPVLA